MTTFPRYPRLDGMSVDEMRHFTRVLRHAGHEVAEAKGFVDVAARDLVGRWDSAAATAWQTTYGRVVADITALSEAHVSSSLVLDGWINALSDAQDTWHSRHSAYEDAERDMDAAVDRLEDQKSSALAAAHTTHDPDQVRRVEQDYDRRIAHERDVAHDKRAAAIKAAQDSNDDVFYTQTVKVAKQLEDIAKTLSIKPDKKAVDAESAYRKGLDSSATVASVVGFKNMLREVTSARALYSALSGGDRTAAIAATRLAYETMHDLINRYGERSPQVDAAYVALEDSRLPAEPVAAKALAGFDAVDDLKSGDLEVPGALGLLGLAAGLAGDEVTLHSGASNLDKVLAGANIGGFVVALGGTSAGLTDTAIISAMASANIFDFVPGVGLVIFGVTSVVISAEWMVKNFDELKHLPGATVDADGRLLLHAGKSIISFDRDLGSVLVNGVKAAPADAFKHLLDVGLLGKLIDAV